MDSLLSDCFYTWTSIESMPVSAEGNPDMKMLRFISTHFPVRKKITSMRAIHLMSRVIPTFCILKMMSVI